MEFEKYMELLQKYKELCSGEIERRKLYDFQINILDEIVALENLVRENEAKIKEQKGRKANYRQEIIEISNSINLMKDNIFHLKGDIIRVKEIMDALTYTLFSKFDLNHCSIMIWSKPHLTSSCDNSHRPCSSCQTRRRMNILFINTI